MIEEEGITAPSKVSCLCLHTASLRNPRFVLSHHTTSLSADKLASVFPIRRRKKVCVPWPRHLSPQGTYSTPFSCRLPSNSRATSSTGVDSIFRTIRDGRLRKRKASLLRAVIWNLGSLKITYGYRDALHHSSRSSEGDKKINYDMTNQGERSTIFRKFSQASVGICWEGNKNKKFGGVGT
jgi:hypothetical protein